MSWVILLWPDRSCRCWMLLEKNTTTTGQGIWKRWFETQGYWAGHCALYLNFSWQTRSTLPNLRGWWVVLVGEGGVLVPSSCTETGGCGLDFTPTSTHLGFKDSAGVLCHTVAWLITSRYCCPLMSFMLSVHVPSICSSPPLSHNTPPASHINCVSALAFTSQIFIWTFNCQTPTLHVLTQQ